MHTVLECSRNSYECFVCLLCSSTFCLCIFLLWSNILSQKLYFLYMDLLHLSQQASYSRLVRDYEGDMLVDLEGDMQSALGNLIYSDRSLPALFFVRIPTVFQHCMRAPLLCSSTFLHAFLLFLSTFLCAHPYCTPARPRAENNPIWVHYACIAIAILLPLALFFVRIPTVFQHGLRALLLCSST